MFKDSLKEDIEAKSQPDLNHTLAFAKSLPPAPFFISQIQWKS